MWSRFAERWHGYGRELHRFMLEFMGAPTAPPGIEVRGAAGTSRVIDCVINERGLH